MKISIGEVKSSGGIRTIKPTSADDLFLTSASYEPRTSCVAECLSEDYRSKRAIVYVNKEFLVSPDGRTRAALELRRELLSHHSDFTSVAEGSWWDAKIQLGALSSALSSQNLANSEGLAITFDITTFNREALLVATALLYSRFPHAKIRALYVSPSNMGDWLSRGFRKVRNVMGFSGNQDPNRPNALVILSGFEPERTLKIIEEHEPMRVLLGIGNPPTRPSFLERNVADQRLILARQTVESFEFPTNDVIARRYC
jgi:hypothetical protein